MTVDSALSATSENPVQNKVVKAALDMKADASALAGKQDTLTAGQNITISGNTISAYADSAEIAADVTDWLDANVTPVGSAVVVDSSLSVSGAAADAKVTGDVAFTESAKQALLDSLENVEWIGDGQDFYNAAYYAFGTGQAEVAFADAYEYGEVTPNGNSYTVFPSGDSANKLRARAKQEYIKKIPSGATSCVVTIPTEMFVSGKYKYGWAFYTENFEQIMSSVIGWIASAQTVRSDSIPSNAVYYMLYIASTGSDAINLSEIDYSAASIIFNNSAADYAKVPWGVVAETPNELKTPPTKDSFILSVNHRGYSTSAPENTLPAFIMSRKKGFRYVETDVLFTSDNVPVLLHDSTINRTARNADGTTISESTSISSITFEQARTYDFGIWKGSEYAGTKIPSFAEFIQLCKQLSITPMIELKNEITWTNEQIDIVADLIRDVGMQNHVMFLSFSYDALAKMRTHFPKAMLGLGFEGTNNVTNITNMANAAKDLQNGENTVCLSLRNSTMTAELFSIIESKGICSLVWTVNTETECLNLHRNVIGVLSNSLNAGQLIEDALINS